MERGDNLEKKYHTHNLYFTPEQIAIQSLVDKMLEKSDKQYFEILNNILESIYNE